MKKLEPGRGVACGRRVGAGVAVAGAFVGVDVAGRGVPVGGTGVAVGSSVGSGGRFLRGLFLLRCFVGRCPVDVQGRCRPSGQLRGVGHQQVLANLDGRVGAEVVVGRFDDVRRCDAVLGGNVADRFSTEGCVEDAGRLRDAKVLAGLDVIGANDVGLVALGNHLGRGERLVALEPETRGNAAERIAPDHGVNAVGLAVILTLFGRGRGRRTRCCRSGDLGESEGVQTADRVGLLLRRRGGLERKHCEEEGVVDRRQGLLDDLLGLAGNGRLPRDGDLVLCRGSCEAFDYGGAAGLVGGEEEGGNSDNAEHAGDGQVQDNTRRCRSLKRLSLALPSSGTGDKPAGMPPGPDGGPPGALPELAFLQPNFDTRRAHLNSASQQ